MREKTEQLLYGVFCRPRMHCEDIESLRDLLLFVQGVSCGLRPPHGASDLAGFGRFLSQKFNRPSGLSWTAIILEMYGDCPLPETCEAVGRLFEEWCHSLTPDP